MLHRWRLAAALAVALPAGLLLSLAAQGGGVLAAAVASPAPSIPGASLDAQLGAPQQQLAAWQSACCAHIRLRQLRMPGTHDAGTYRWTLPENLPLLVDEVAAAVFNLIGDLSRTQTLTVYEQLLGGSRLLDLRLAVNPWLPLQQRSGFAAAATAAAAAGHQQQRRGLVLDAQQLESSVDYGVYGGPLSATELRGALVASHSLPGAPLAEMLADVARFLREQPGELVTLMVKGDTIDVNVAGSERMTRAAWAAAAAEFAQQLAGVPLLSQQQVEQEPIGQLGGSLLLVSCDLQIAGLAGALCGKLQIMESWANGTDSEEVPQLRDRLLSWLHFWQASGWPRQNREPFMLLASAEVTLGASTIMQILRNKLWPWLAEQQAAEQQAAHGQQQLLLLRAQQQRGSQLQQQGAVRMQLQRQMEREVRRLLRGPSTLHQLGEETNAELLASVLRNAQVPNDFSVWSMDAIDGPAGSQLVAFIVALNSLPSSAASQNKH